MANLLTMADIQAILGLHERGWRQRRIARELDVDRETVAKYIRASGCVPKPAKAPLGSEPVCDASAPAEPPLDLAVSTEASAVAISSERECGRSACEPYWQTILEKLEQGLSGQRIYQDLRSEGFGHEYHSVRRFVAKLRGTRPLPFRRMECEAGEEAQVDFGTGAWIELPTGKRRRLCAGQRAEGPPFFNPGGRERSSRPVRDGRGRHPHPRHDPQASRQAVWGSRAWSLTAVAGGSVPVLP